MVTRSEWEEHKAAYEAEVSDLVAMLRDGSDEYVVEIAGEALEHFHDAMMAGDDAARRENQLVIDACVDTLYRITLHARSDKRPDGQGWSAPPEGRSRFDCEADARKWLGEQLAAVPGNAPMHGQPGRFVVTIDGCRIDVHAKGLFGLSGGFDLNVIDLDRPFISGTGYRSMLWSGGYWGEPPYTCDPGMEFEEFARLFVEGDLKRGDRGKVKPELPLYRPPFGLSINKSDPPQSIAERWRNDRASDPAWQKGGHLASLPSLTATGVAIREDKRGQFALVF